MVWTKNRHTDQWKKIRELGKKTNLWSINIQQWNNK